MRELTTWSKGQFWSSWQDTALIIQDAYLLQCFCFLVSFTISGDVSVQSKSPSLFFVLRNKSLLSVPYLVLQLPFSPENVKKNIQVKFQAYYLLN